MELDVVTEVDPAFSLLKYNKDEHSTTVLDIIKELEEEKLPANPIMRWLY